MSKGVSPLIASVLLIAVTMAIAGVMATWATQFTATKMSESNTGSDCIGAIDISNLQFSGTNVTVKIRNVAERINLTNIKVSLEYSDASLSKQHAGKNIGDYNASDPIAPGEATYLVYDTGSTVKPISLEIRSGNCIKYPATLYFR